MSLLEVKNLTVEFATRRGTVRAVDDISYDLGEGETLGLVGESGSGKSVSSLALMGLLPPQAKWHAQTFQFMEHDLSKLSERAYQDLRGCKLGMIFQDPMTSLNPCYTIEFQIAEVIKVHAKQKISKADLRSAVVELLRKVGIPNPEDRLKSYPHQLSGGMAQRVMIAMAVSCQPKLLIADEPTTALDVTIQAQILNLLKELQSQLGMALILISHDLAVVAQMAKKIAVMYAGQIVEYGPLEEVLARPEHPYTEALLKCRPDTQAVPKKAALQTIPGSIPDLAFRPTGCQFHTRCTYAQEKCRREEPKLYQLGAQRAKCFFPVNTPPEMRPPMTAPILEVKNLVKHFPIKKMFREVSTVKALDGVSFQLTKGETLAIVGESGSGKSTIAKCLMGIETPTSGEILFGGKPKDSWDKKNIRRQIQMIFQDPYSSLNPRRKAWEIVAEPMVINRPDMTSDQIRKRAFELLERVELRAEQGERFPHMFSGGQRQRIGIARALSLEPQILICDEPVSALDVSIQAQILNLLMNLQRELQVSYLFISHDLSVVKHFSDRVVVIHGGVIKEFGKTEFVFQNPQDPYTRLLLDSSPKLAKRDHFLRTQ